MNKEVGMYRTKQNRRHLENRKEKDKKNDKTEVRVYRREQ